MQFSSCLTGNRAELIPRQQTWQKHAGVRLTFGADEAPADVYVFVVLAAFAGSEVVWTQEAVVGENQAARRHAVIVGVIGHGAAHASSQPTWETHTKSQTLNKISA